MNLASYVAEHATITPNADIASRWHSRIVPKALHTAGRAGADSYLAQYGRGIKPPKLVLLARMAETQASPDFAARIWEEAFFLTTGSRETFVPLPSISTVTASPVPPPAVPTTSGLQPQLLVALDRYAAFRLLDSDAYCIQEKHDGERLMPRVLPSCHVTAGNKKGLTRAIPLCIADALATMLPCDLDGELVGSTFYAFDMLALHSVDMTGLPYRERHAILAKSLPSSPHIKLVRLVTGTDAKRAFAAELEARNAEGFVLKQLDAPYQAGDRHGTQWKYQFRGLLAVVVGPQNGAKSSVAMLVRRPDDTERNLGNVTIPAGNPIPPAGSILEVEYLYCHPGLNGKLAQPVFKCLRTDAEPADCTDTKIKVKATP